MEYEERIRSVYTALKESGDIDPRDVADLAIAVVQEEAKDRRTEVMNERKDARVQQMRGDSDQGQQSSGGNWRSEPATDAQKKALDNLGVDYESDLTKGAASDLIDEARQEAEA